MTEEEFADRLQDCRGQAEVDDLVDAAVEQRLPLDVIRECLDAQERMEQETRVMLDTVSHCFAAACVLFGLVSFLLFVWRNVSL